MTTQNLMFRAQDMGSDSESTTMSCCGDGSHAANRAFQSQIIVNVNQAGERLQDLSDDEIAAVLCHEMSHSSAVAPESEMTWWTADAPNWKNYLEATRDWSYDLNEIKKYADC